MSLNAKRIEAYTPGRKIHVFLDNEQNYLAEPPFSIQRYADEIGRGPYSTKENAQFYPHLGWTVADRTYDINTFSENTSSTPLVATVASGITQRATVRKPTDSEFPSMGANGSLFASQTQYEYVKGVAAGDAWNASVLSADQSAFASVNTAIEAVPLDRVWKSTTNDTGTGSILWYVRIPGDVQSMPGKITTLYFNGPAGRDIYHTGNGQYALELYGTGVALLWENGSAGWVQRAKFIWNFGSITGRAWYIYISRQPFVGYSYGGNGLIYITASSGSPNDPIDTIGEQLIPAMNSRGGVTTNNQYVYGIPTTHHAQPSMEIMPLRMDVRRDIRMGFNVYGQDTNQTAIINDAPFVPHQLWYDTSNEIVLLWDGETPVGTSITCKLFNADTDTELTVLSTAGNYKTYQPSFDLRRLYVQITMVGSASGTPVFRSYKVYRDAIFSEPVDTFSNEVPSNVIREISIRGAERDPSQETAKIVFDNTLNSDLLDRLSVRGSIPIRIETEYDSADSSKRCVLFKGFIERPEGMRKGFGHGSKSMAGGNYQTNNFPDQERREYTCACNGEWQRLAESLVFTRQLFWDYTNGEPYKVTDLIANMIEWAGYDANTEIQMDDFDIRLFVDRDAKQASIEPLSPILKSVMELLATYLPGFLHKDYNTDVWRYINPPTTPYTNLARFSYNNPETGVAQMFRADVYPAPTTGGGITYDSRAVTIPIHKGTLMESINRPEGNFVLVATMGGVHLGSFMPKAFYSRAVNPRSYDAFAEYPADPDHPDYLGRFVPIWVVLPSLNLLADDKKIQDACDWVCRRIFDVACTGRKTLTFEAPLVFIEHEDDNTKVRPLRYYDPVIVDDVQYLVRSVNPMFKKSHIMTAMYELETPRDEL